MDIDAQPTHARAFGASSRFSGRGVEQQLSHDSIAVETSTLSETAGLKLVCMQKIVSFLVLASVTFLPVALPQSSPPQSENVWFWFGDCSEAKVMGLQLLLDGKPIYQSLFRACQMNRTTANTDREQKVRTPFHFSGGHTFQGTYHTKKTETIEGTIWQAGADPDDILLGVSFLAHGQVLLNTVHIVRPGKP